MKKTNTNNKGISFRANRNRYQAQFSYAGIKTYIGSYKTLEEAVKARINFINNLK